ncbi:MAG: thioredoxin family protein, partial [Hymenobacteraceae bacterium]|nr:thioredoxin family protein [Hymenobacteraceae bacterium]
DAAQSVPVIAAMAAVTPAINLRLLLRDDFPAIMDCYLTNGGRSIPKLICFDAETRQELFTWGPRPAEAQEMVTTMKADPSVTKAQFIEQIQLWYARDRTRSTQAELAALLKNVM